MFIVDCLPLSKGLNKESLSYFSLSFIESGSLIRVNLRGKNVPALVLESRDAREIKSEIKSANFQVKKVIAFSSKPFIQKEFLEAVQESAEYFVATKGAVLSHLIPSFILENPNLLSILKDNSQEKQNQNSGEKNKIDEAVILQTGDEERFAQYKSLIREEFARKKSIFLCLPQNEAVLEAKEKLERGIESFVCVFHKDMSKKDLKEEWKKIFTTTHPILVISTSKWLFLPRSDLGTIILDSENEIGWKTLYKPFIDLRFFIEKLALKKNIRLVLGDSFLRTETLYRHEIKELGEFEHIKWRPPQTIKTNIVDLREITKKEKDFRTISPEILELIKENSKKGTHTFIFAARKGLSGTTVCRDCGEQVKCFNCTSPMVLYKTKTNNVFKCHQCGEVRDAAEVCQNCKSWKLSAFGSGIDRVAEEIKKDLPEINIFEINKDSVSTSIKARKIAKSFYESKGSVLLGTEMALFYLYKKVNTTIIASFDSLFSIPDFRIREKIFRIILQTKNLAKENFIIQSRNPTDRTVEFASFDNLEDFYKKEMEDRKVLGYPPFGIFIKITTRGNKNFVTKETETLKKFFPENTATIFNSVHERKGEQSAVNAVIKMPREKWVDKTLLYTLKSLPPHFEIKVDPDNLL